MKKTAEIFNIQRFSVHDGDGIRTTVFFSGCPLRCLWCHNPEGMMFARRLLYHSEKCVGCGRCVSACPAGANSMAPDGRAVTDRARCTSCGKCVPMCLAEARAVAGTARTVDEIVRICVSDRMFYEESGGGVTLSGGEVMAQDTDFLLSLLRALDGEGISVNIDTCGHVPYEKLYAVMPYVDTFLYDIKSADDEKHTRFTGVGNALILENLRRLSGDGAKIYIRVPVIAPGDEDTGFDGANFTDGDIESLTRVLGGIKYSRVCLLPYHNTGEYKCVSLGMKPRRFSAPTKDDLERIKNTLARAGVTPVVTGG